jgi:two-component system phosphate regulon sensor histidine kinase PhoR
MDNLTADECLEPAKGVILSPMQNVPREEAAILPETGTRLDEATLRAVLEGLAEPAVAVDADAVVLAHNATARALFPGLRVEDPLSLTVRDPAILTVVMEALATGASNRIDFTRRVPDDRAFLVHVSRIGEAGALVTFRDLTESRRLERMRADFVANASHELRTPLAALLGFIETLEGPARDDPAARARFLGVMREQAQRMARLIDDLLSLSRIESRTHMAPTDRVDLAALAREGMEALCVIARDAGVAVTFTAPTDPVTIAGDRDELLRLIENLVENAIKYGGDDGPVEARVEIADGHATFEVRDHGRGIAQEHLPRLTERFYRVDAGDSRNRGGTGLGLAIVKHIATRHRGRLEIRSTPGEGSVFRVRLPLIAT